MTRGETGFTNGPADAFVRTDLLSATWALAGGPNYLEGRGQAVLDAVARLTDKHGRVRVDRPLIETMNNTARHLQQTVTPFQGMLEAPRSVAEVYQTHRRALRDLVAARNQVLTAVLEDLATRVMNALQGVSWIDLETHGADHKQPPWPAAQDNQEG